MGTMNELLNARTIDALRAELTDAASTLVPPVAVDWSHLAQASHDVDGLSLRARSDLVSVAILADLPDDYGTAAAVFRRALDSARFSGWMIWPVTETVTTLALAADRATTTHASTPEPDAFADGLALLAELTPRLTAEFAIRRFLEADLDRSLAIVTTWTTSDDEHVRRLASEGTRAFLPWAIRVRSLLAHPEATVPILDLLRHDDSDYVRRSVANHLNDLARENADLVTTLAARWMREGDRATRDAAQDAGPGTPDPTTAWVVRHGLRTLVKKGNPEALAIMGFEVAEVEVSLPTLDKDPVPLPGELTFNFDITNTSASDARLAVDYVVHYLKSNGTQAGKVFKLASVLVGAGQTVNLRKKHAFRPMTTRVHYPGAHALEIQVNGQRYSRVEFTLGE